MCDAIAMRWWRGLLFRYRQAYEGVTECIMPNGWKDELEELARPRCSLSGHCHRAVERAMKDGKEAEREGEW
jgi:hypothetical protein